MRRGLIIAVAGVALVGASYALAQNVEGLDIQAVLGRGESGEKDAQALADEVLRRSKDMQDEARSVAEQGQANMQRNAGRVGGGPAGPIDFDELVRTASANQTEGGRAPQLIVFASLSMPPDSLKQLIRDTAKAGGSVVFNGFPGNSMKAFQQGILKVVEKNEDYGNIGIDPRLFRAFEVTSVPTFVVVSSDFDVCDGFDCKTVVPPFDRMSGNVTLEHVLETFTQGRGPGSPISAQALGRLKRGPA
jgi:conjugal transfer pilus assembly protein TrbC